MAHPIYPESYIAPDNLYTATVYEKGVSRCFHHFQDPNIMLKIKAEVVFW